jgi:hypothetical protein
MTPPRHMSHPNEVLDGETIALALIPLHPYLYTTPNEETVISCYMSRLDAPSDKETVTSRYMSHLDGPSNEETKTSHCISDHDVTSNKNTKNKLGYFGHNFFTIG